MTLSDVRPGRPRFAPGDRATLRDPGVPPDATRPVALYYRVLAAHATTAHFARWTLAHDRFAGQTVTVDVVSAVTGLVWCRPDGETEHLIAHPDMLAGEEAACLCPSLQLANYGHAPECGWLLARARR